MHGLVDQFPGSEAPAAQPQDRSGGHLMEPAARLLELSRERQQHELRRIEELTGTETVYFRRRRLVAVCSIICYVLGLFLLASAFRVSDLAIASILALLGPLVGSFGPMAIWYGFWVSEGDL